MNNVFYDKCVISDTWKCHTLPFESTALDHSAISPIGEY